MSELLKLKSMERRSATRYPVKWPVKIDGGEGVTRDMSVTGAYIEVDRQLACGDSVRLRATLPDWEGLPGWFVAEGQVVRVEAIGTKWGLGIRFTSIGFEC